ncbi:amino acid ABC transporter permease [Alicyclobacillus sp.]|uniref:amino acid ABC transporter permease n=1 Tax=Alicyclobacillus sp. TaxID=61169 RepID=UPI0025BA6B57|nr:amino acid ABC transporter permease [Alicyclobacillus sp.]MCL6516618.1 amino acid ABC transporter permease [Alicyclobacillus sp.]
MNHIWEQWPQIWAGFLSTVEFSVIAILLGTVIGLIAALMKLARFAPARWLSTVYVELFRGTPLLVQLFFIALGLPAVLPLNKWFGPQTYPLVAGAVGLALNEGAYITEIIRAGILGVDRGQWEAAASIGMSRGQTMRHIILPQAFKRMIPPLVNQFAQTVKDTSLLAPIAITELVYSAQEVISVYFNAFSMWLVVALMYFVVIFLITRFAAYLERRLQIDKR